MQAQIQQRSKKNKVTVPFYSPPCRLYGQTSADIIKEARAAIMTSPVGIKPVFTSRPFTPNQKERTLFGNIKKNKSRPPSSFSLRYLKGEELSSRIKLPSIDTLPQKKNYPTFHFSKNLSLSNLTEDYDAEAFAEITTVNADKLPTWKKSHYCSKEGRLSRVASLNDLHRSFTGDSYYKKEENLNSFRRENFEPNQYYSDLNVRKLIGDTVKSEEDVIYYEQGSQNLLMAKGGGDYEVPESTLGEIIVSDNQEEPSRQTPLPIGDVCIKPEKLSREMDEISAEGGTKAKGAAEIEEKKIAINEDLNRKTIELEEEILMTKKEQEDSQGKKQYCKNENVAEKSIVTGSKSEYLVSLKAGFKSPAIIKQPEPPVPLEILELYETAKYYGVDIDKRGTELFTAVGKCNKNLSVEVTEKSNDNLQMKESIKINNSEETEKKGTLSGKNQNKTTSQESSENVEYVMNNKKRYHIVADKEDTKEKAYKKWSNKQENSSTAPECNLSNDSWDLFWKNSYYRGKEEKEEKSLKDADRECLKGLVNKIAALIKKGPNNHEIYETTSQLYGLIKNNKMVLDSKAKENISRVLYLYVDNENPEVLLSLAKIFFLLKEETCLSVACKIIFKVARFDTNDHFFLNEEDVLELFLEGIGRASPLDCAESCIYSYGALKFLTLNHSILSRILHMGALDLMTLHLKMINNAYSESGKVGEQTQHALFQLTGALRHVAAGEGALSLFLTTNCINILCNTLRFFSKDEDVIVNISRTLSLLSTDEIVTQSLMQIENILTTLIELIERYRENDKILIRLAFSLGNIVEHSDLARVQLSRSDAALTVLLNVLKLYIDKDLEISLGRGDRPNSDELSPEIIDDVIVKVIRIIANMSMNPIVGSNLSPTTKERKSLQLSKLLSILLMRKDPGITLLATLGCLNNISYYCNTHSVLIDITQGVERVLGLESVECQIEAARVLGNLTRHKEIRDLIYSTGGVDLLSKLLSSTDQEVVRCACGALVNMMLDSETRKSFVKAQGIDKYVDFYLHVLHYTLPGGQFKKPLDRRRLVKTLEAFPGDWSLASLAARAIWNSCGDDVSSAMLHNNVEHLLNILASSLEEENWKDGDPAWEEFASVATDLLEKISAHLESI